MRGGKLPRTRAASAIANDQAALSIIVHELSLKVHEPTATSMVTMLDYDAESDAVRLAFAGM